MFTKTSKNQKYFLWILLLFLTPALCPAASADEWELQANQTLRRWLHAAKLTADSLCSEQPGSLLPELIQFYQYRHYQPAWVDRYGLLPEGETVLATIRQAAVQGLEFPDYDDRMLNGLLSHLLDVHTADRPPQAHIDNQIKLDLMLTKMILRYVIHLSNGRTAPSIINIEDKPEASSNPDLAIKLAAVRNGSGLASYLSQLEPKHPTYRALQKSLIEYSKIKESGGWPLIDKGPKLQFGDRGTRVATLRHRLAVSGDIEFDSKAMADHFDDALAIAVMRFQRRHGMMADGIAGPGTIAAMNVPVDKRIRQIELNLERWRWMPPAFEPYHIFVNIPGFELKVVDGDRTVKAMRVVVGRKDRPTPVLSSMMTYLELNPYWNVPSKIAREDLLPKIQKDPHFLAQQNFQVFDSWQEDARALDPLSVDWAALSEDHFPFRLRQEPTPQNALGRVKFMFPNEHSVYIHDTPSKILFARSARSYSSGCVRVENPLELVALLLNRQDWSQEKLSDALTSGERQVVVLKKPVPVYLAYLTAWVEENGQIHFREDIYGHDQELQAFLDESAAAEQRCAAATRPIYIVRTEKGDHPAKGI